MLEDVGTEEELEDEGFEDTALDPTVEVLDLSSEPSSVTTSSAHIPTPTSLQASAGPASAIAPASPEQQLIVHESTDSHSGPSALPTGSAPVLPTPTGLPATTPAATACPFSSPPITLAPPQQQLAFNFLTKKSSTTSSASVPPLPTALTTTFSAATATAGSQTITPAAPEQQPAVDEHGIPGKDRVDSLAEYLVGLRSETGQTLSNQQELEQPTSIIVPGDWVFVKVIKKAAQGGKDHSRFS
ncbi:mucin-7-like isoform X1 [Seriola aureovittata]|uniref:mucin-7-like isoform X1 n=1 Tax=Seriola aureovittata TaxID=2871759 RepID=UPI0024BEE536|nr:mucin-7-like isoform X1 [Seriola aureovittata]